MIYQVTFLVQDEAHKVIISQAVQGFGGKVVDELSIGRRKLVYPIEQVTEANYFTYHIAIGTDKLSEFEKKLRFQNEILRFLVIRTETVVKPRVIEPFKVKEQLPTTTQPQQIEVAPMVKKTKAPIKSEKPKKESSKPDKTQEQERLKALDEKLKQLLQE